MLQALTHWVWVHIRGVTFALTVALSTILLIRGPQATLNPVRWGAIYLVSAGQAIYQFPIRLATLRNENRFLRSRVLMQVTQDAATRELLLENARLRQMLGFRERSRFSLIGARVLSHDAELPPTTIVIDAGFADGVLPNLPVMTPEGLVGRVDGRPASRRSVVRLITDPSLRVSVVVENEDRGMGLLRWDGVRMRVENVAQEARIREGEPVVTSGLGGLFPPGIYIGRVLKVRNDPHALFKEMIITPGARIDRLEEIFVVRDLSSSPGTTPEAADALGR